MRGRGTLSITVDGNAEEVDGLGLVLSGEGGALPFALPRQPLRIQRGRVLIAWDDVAVFHDDIDARLSVRFSNGRREGPATPVAVRSAGFVEWTALIVGTLSCLFLVAAGRVLWPTVRRLLREPARPQD